MIKTFQDYVRMRESNVLERPGIGSNGAGKDANSRDKDLVKLITIAWHRYSGETRDFFTQLATKDPDIKKIMNVLDSVNSEDPIKKGPPEQDIIAKPLADSGIGAEE